ncbi:group III truncated hemoglobin [Hymenobacter sp. GOD-10R]|uniref:group III truncated hemoglobin n=1 Tax=Hymenobacter sp. GOD-10R TaxID=3093922 RepID=UPI002D76EA35|nr:group III truncated hemoglobin [Hymenobacter sp. GOD-10R]WRQ27732.1 group III truncated hemoglobin [Hymenobacter sp. GOD-10R]
MPALPDIRTEADITTLINAFYAKVFPDELLGPIFSADVQIHWPQPFYTMGAFWKRVLLNTGGNDGWPFPGGLVLPNTGEYFRRWQQLFLAAVEDNFTGPIAEAAKERAQEIVQMFENKRPPRTLSSLLGLCQ